MNDPSGPIGGVDPHEVDLIRRAASGDERAFETLVAAHAPAVVSLAAATLGDRARGRDIGQDVFVRLHRSLGTLRHEARLRTWLVRVTLNACADARRQDHRARRLTSVDDVAGTAVDGRENAEMRAVRESEWTRLRRAIAALPEDERVLISLRYDAGLEYRRIAGELALPPGTVATRMARALRRLRAALADS